MSPDTATILLTYCLSSEKISPQKGLAEMQSVTMSPRVGSNSCFASGEVISKSLSWSVGIIEAPETIVGRITRTIQRMEATTVSTEGATDLVFIRDVSWLMGKRARLTAIEIMDRLH